MTVSGNEIPYNVDTQGIESLLQSIDEKLGMTNETLSSLAETEETDGQEETETGSDNSVEMYEAVQRLEMRVDMQIKMQFAGIIVLIFSISMVGAFLILKVLPKR